MAAYAALPGQPLMPSGPYAPPASLSPAPYPYGIPMPPKKSNVGTIVAVVSGLLIIGLVIFLIYKYGGSSSSSSSSSSSGTTGSSTSGGSSTSSSSGTPSGTPVVTHTYTGPQAATDIAGYDINCSTAAAQQTAACKGVGGIAVAKTTCDAFPGCTAFVYSDANNLFYLKVVDPRIIGASSVGNPATELYVQVQPSS